MARLSPNGRNAAEQKRAGKSNFCLHGVGSVEA
jgi:hypothetical protein